MYIKTVRKSLKGSWRPRQRPPRRHGLDPLQSFVEARLPEVGFNGKVLERELPEKGWEGNYATLARTSNSSTRVCSASSTEASR